MYDYMKALQKRFDRQPHPELDAQVDRVQAELRRDMDAAGRKKLLRLLDAQNALLAESKLMSFTAGFKLILKKNGLPQELNVHSLRHTAASLMIAGGTDVATVAGILGHSQPSTTLDIYTHAFDKNKKAASAGLQGMLEI